MLRNSLRGMAVPKISQLSKGVGVKIVLKKDQPTGNLTTGKISDILTRRDHPRGIKVRLTDGQIGRVQSLTSPHQVSPTGQTAGTGIDMKPEYSNARLGDSRHSGNSRRRGGEHSSQEAQKLDRAPQESLSLFDYVRMPPSKATVTSPEVADAVLTDQERLELEFPKLDSALISAILIDYPEIAEARAVLSSLS